MVSLQSTPSSEHRRILTVRAEQTGRVFAELELGPEEYRDNGALTNMAPGDLDVAVETSTTLRGGA